MYDILPELYREVATQIIERTCNRDYYSGTFDFEWEDVECHMVLSAVVYYKEVCYPEGLFDVVSDLSPVWWEFHTYRDGEEILNNFSFNEMREYLPD